MFLPITEHTFATFTVFHYKIGYCFVLSYIHRTLDRQLYRATMGTSDITDQGEQQFYTGLTKLLHKKHDE